MMHLFERHVAIAHHGTQGKGREVQLLKTIAGARKGMRPLFALPL